MSDIIFQTGHGRVFIQWGGASPLNIVEYQGQARMGGFDASEGEPTPIEEPSDYQADEFNEVDEVRGERSRPTTSLIARFGDVNKILTATCPFTIQAHYGKCENPLLFNEGWEAILAFSHARFSTKSGDDLTAYESSGRGPITLTGNISARRMWFLTKLTLAEVAGGAIDKEVVGVLSFDYISCGDCGYLSNGEQRFLILTEGSGAGSPGLSAELIVTSDTGATLDQYDIDTLTGDDQPSGFAVVGKYIVVVSQVAGSLSYADFSDPGTWVEVTTGFVGGPNAIFSIRPSKTWLVGQSGYIYLLTSPGAGVTVQSAGTATAENLVSIDAVDTKYALAGGENGALVTTANGGITWTAVATSPTVGTINTVRMRSRYEWIVGDSLGYLYATSDGGATWSSVTYPLQGMGEVFDLDFCRDNDSPFGFMVASAADGMGYVFRTLDGGYSWYQLPDYNAVTPTNTGLKHLGVGISGNVAMAGGVKTDADGILIVAS